MGKPKNRTAWTCPICGQQLSNAGRVGHMRWKHGRDHAAPLLSVAKPTPQGEIRRRAKLFEVSTAKLTELDRMHHTSSVLVSLFFEADPTTENVAKADALLARLAEERHTDKAEAVRFIEAEKERWRAWFEAGKPPLFTKPRKPK